LAKPFEFVVFNFFNVCTYCTYIHNIHHFALLLCWTHVTDWSTDDPGGAGQCRYVVAKARNSTPHQI
jgi:hypothetical protein